MNVESFWAQALNIEPSELEKWKQVAPDNAPLPAWGVLQGHMDENQYLNWARNFYGLATVDSHYLLENFNPQLLQTHSSSNWSNHILPLAEWDGFLFVACVEPAVNLQWNVPVKFILASPKALQQAWQKYQGQKQASAEPEKELSAADKFALQQAEEAKKKKAPEAQPTEQPNAMDAALNDLNSVAPAPEPTEAPVAPPQAAAPAPAPPQPEAAEPPPVAAPEVQSAAPTGFESMAADLENQNSAPSAAKDDPFAGLSVDSGNSSAQDSGMEGLDFGSAAPAASSEPPAMEGLDLGSDSEAPAIEGLDLSAMGEDQQQAAAPAMEGLDLSNLQSTTDSTDQEAPLNFDSLNESSEAPAAPSEPVAPVAEPAAAPVETIEAQPEPPPQQAVEPTAAEPAETANDNVTPLQGLDELNPENKIDVDPGTSLAQSKNLKQALAFVLKESLQAGYTHLIYFSHNINSGLLKAELWSDAWTATKAQQKVNTTDSSFFKVVIRTNHPYHGPPSQCPFHKSFFESWGLAQLPGNITALPVKSSQQIKGVVVLVGPEDSYQPRNLTEMENLAKQLGQFLANSGFMAA